MDDELLDQFLSEGRDLVIEAQGELARLARDPGLKAAVDAAFRAIHTLKGSVAIFDMAPAEQVLHAAEDMLDSARKAGSPLRAIDIDTLVACLDQTDRWIDELAGRGSLSADAPIVAAALLAGIAQGDVSHGSARPKDESSEPSLAMWAQALGHRRAAQLAKADRPLIGFRYVPDGDAFFRGDDPLAVAMAVPDLAAIDVLPRDGAWPDPATIDPFACFVAIEGLSAASEQQVRDALRLVFDQVDVHVWSPDAVPAPNADAAVAGEDTALRVDAARIDHLADGVGELIAIVNAFAPLISQAVAIDSGLAEAIRRAHASLDRAVDDIRQSVIAIREVPLTSSLRRLPRMVREIAAALGKPVDFVMAGERIAVDKQIADGLFEPLLHLLRNAIDHGIEPAAARTAAGKPATGRIGLTIQREGSDIVVLLDDDGGGIDSERVRTVAVERGLIDAVAAAGLDSRATTALIFAPGFSTATQVSAVSGRGVGMDAVRAAIERLRGAIEVESTPGSGSRFTLRLPASAITTRLLTIWAGSERYAVPFDQIAETVRVPADRLMRVGSGTACVLRDRTVPVLDLAALLAADGHEGRTDVASASSNAGMVDLLISRGGGEPVALQVDRFGEKMDAMVRQPGALLERLPGIGGTMLTARGDVMVVLDLPGLIG